MRRGELADDTREEPVLPKRPTYSQNWKAYNEAQTNEGDEFIVLLKELCATLEQPLHVNGRPRYPISDMVFGVALKVYSTLSTRRAMSNIRSASAKGMMDCMPSFTSIHRYMEKPETEAGTD